MFSRAPASVRGALVELQHLVAAGDVVGHFRQLVGRDPREHLRRDRHQRGVRDPGAVVAVADFAQLVGADFLKRARVRGLVALDRDEGRHAAHREGAAAVAGCDQPQRVSRKERLIHGHLARGPGSGGRASGRSA